jgi:aminoglycoside phosphotransferase (APT) family kinase protein
VDAPQLHADEIETDAALVRRLLAAQYPEWSDRPITRFPSTGTVNGIYRLGDDLAVRLPRTGRFAADLAKELVCLPALAPLLPVRIPQPVAVGEPGDEFPFPWAVYRWLPGEPCVPARHGDDPVLATVLAGFVAALHAVDASAGPRSGRAETLPQRDAVTRGAIDAARDVVDAEAVIAVWDGALAATAWDGADVWIHGDLLPPNLLVEHDRLTAVLDFGCVGLGDPACDLISAWSVFRGEARTTFRDALGVDDATWRRGRGWALSINMLIIPYYARTNPRFVEMALRTIAEVLADSRADAP